MAFPVMDKRRLARMGCTGHPSKADRLEAEPTTRPRSVVASCRGLPMARVPRGDWPEAMEVPFRVVARALIRRILQASLAVRATAKLAMARPWFPTRAVPSSPRS